MKIRTLLVIMAMTSSVQADDFKTCASAINTTVNFMTSTYGVNPADVSVQVVSANKPARDKAVIADVVASAGKHKCSLKLTPAYLRKESIAVCEWTFQTLTCDSPETLKLTVIDEPAWADEKASVNATREGLRKGLEQSNTPPDSN